ncbi:BgTH12-02046 [Blumeria graminis f. sp. triticale]|uniref:Bgt-4436 n=3 Tax=Blumeria graminis TaxID=34373 RepID=A0A381LA09_BLUGR|nr:hypothetical protein BGT96224_4436 [Blumeria graminis f. sp. tritici 96224]CAD6501800.1 BgTH12-02046 [Blumeria graminis f. sp. triticale]VDB84447.1 Bgt-4436 [Blumeria graminis f. sp. tritici]
MSNLLSHDELHGSSTMINLTIALMALISIIMLLSATLYFIRTSRRRRALARQQILPMHENSHSMNSYHPRRQQRSQYNSEKQFSMYSEKSLPGNSFDSSSESIPEIRITFPDEQDEAGRRKSGRVVVVRVGETGIGLEPLKPEDQLPAYEENSGGHFHCVDMDRIGGLKEKSDWYQK